MPHCLACHANASERWAGASDEEYFTSDHRFEYRRCLECEALFIDPVPIDRLREIYPPNYYSFDDRLTTSFVFRIKDWLDQQFYKRFIDRLPHDAIDVLDVGGGVGTQLTAIRRANKRIRRTAVVDLDDDAGVKATELGHEYFCGRFEDYASEKQFAVILMLNLIEHVAHPAELLAKARSLLAPGGIVLIKTPNSDSVDARLFRHHNWGGYHCPRHWVIFNSKSFSALVAKSGLAVRHFEYTQGAPFWTTSVLFALCRTGWIHAGPTRPIPQHPLYSPLNMLFAAVDFVRGWFSKTSQMIVVLENR